MRKSLIAQRLTRRRESRLSATSSAGVAVGRAFNLKVRDILSRSEQVETVEDVRPSSRATCGYAAQWADYRHLRNRAIYSFVAFFAVSFLLIPLLGLLLRFPAFQFLSRVRMLPFLVEVALAGVILYFAYLHYCWECPRCGERFGMLYDECQNCALLKWANDDSESSEHETDPGEGKGTT